MPENDELLYARYLETNDNEALRTLLIRHREELTFFIYGILNNYEDAEEVMLDAYAVAASGTSKFNGKSSFKTWLFAIGRNLALKRLRKKHFLFIPLNEEISDMPQVSEVPETKVLESEKNKMLYDALNKINPEYRQALFLTYFDDMSYDEVAAVMKKNKKQVYNLIERGKKELKNNLTQLGYDII